jgi:hypothetical protein
VVIRIRPASIIGPEFASKYLDMWAYARGIELLLVARQADGQCLYIELKSPIPRRVPVGTLALEPC